MPLQCMKIVYEKKKAITQRKNKREIYEKYIVRERNREKDYVNKLLPKTLCTFLRSFRKRTWSGGRRLRRTGGRKNSRIPWIEIRRKRLWLKSPRRTLLEPAHDAGML